MNRMFAVLGATLLLVGCADALPTGELSASNLDFGVVDVGQSTTRQVTITNRGDAPLRGAIGEACAEFSILSGAGPYAIDPGDNLMVQVQFAPTAAGTFGCTLQTSSCRCGDVVLSGQGVGGMPAACEIIPTSLAWGTLAPGDTLTKSFRIRNTGGGVLSGQCSEACGPYTITKGSLPFALAANETLGVSVRFTAPATDGAYGCTIATGTAILKVATCPDVSCAASVATPQPACTVSPTTLAFGVLDVDEASDRSFTIQNTGAGGPLVGSVVETCPDFSIVAGEGAFSLGAGQSLTVTVRLQSPTPGAKACTVALGQALCANVGCSGTVQSGGSGEITSADLTYLGAFKFGGAGSTLGYSAGRGLGVLANGNLVVSGTDIENTGTMVVCTPATPIITTNVAAMNQATTVATYIDPTGGLWHTEGDYSRSEDIIVMDDRIAFTFFSYYDRAYDARGGLGFMNLSFGSPSGLFYPGDPADVANALGSDNATKSIWYPGKICGQGQQVPAQYVEGGRTLAIGRSRDEYGLDCSAGPSLYFVDPTDITNAVCALCYDQIGQSGVQYVPGPHSRPGYSLTDQTTDMAWIGGTVLFTEAKCLYPSHYYQAGQSGELGDPGVCDENTGFTCGHAGDPLPGYEAHFSLYRVSDLMAVAHGSANNWEPMPYETIDVTGQMVAATCTNSIAGAAFFEPTRRLYVIQLRRNGNGPICHVWSVAQP